MISLWNHVILGPWTLGNGSNCRISWLTIYSWLEYSGGTLWCWSCGSVTFVLRSCYCICEPQEKSTLRKCCAIKASQRKTLKGTNRWKLSGNRTLPHFKWAQVGFVWEGDWLISDKAVVTKGYFTLNMNIQSMPETFYFFLPRKELQMKIEKCGDFSSFSCAWLLFALLLQTTVHC